jgi:predicted amidohydrolase YtcJ
VIEGNKIVAAGPKGSVRAPAGETFDASGLTLLPRLIDTHFYLARTELPHMFLRNGVTSVRDPGAWNQSYDAVKALAVPPPRLF